MKNLEFKEMFRQKAMKVGSLMLAAAVMLGGGISYYNAQNPVPELVTFVDTEGSIEIEGEEVPLAGAKVTKSTKTKKKTKKIKMKKASKKTYKTQGKTTTKTTTKTKKTSKNTTTTETVTSTQVTNSYKKGSKVNTQVTTTKTTVTKTVTPKGSSAVVVDSAQTVSNTEESVAAVQKSTTAVQSGVVSIDQMAPMVGQNVKNAFKNLGFQIVINPSVSYSGLCDARTRMVTLKRADDTIYHELGHFVAFVAGNVDTSSAFKDIYNREKSQYNEYNKSYVLSSSSEYFAESYRNYILNPAALRSSRPETYAAIETALSRITDTQVTRILNVYGAVWNK